MGFFYYVVNLVPVNETCTLAELMQHHQLTEEDCSKQVSNQHLVLFSQSHCGQWRMLPPFLGMETTAAEAIYHGPEEDETKRYTFLLQWQQKKGHKATYKRLINALVKIKRFQDADGVCSELKKSLTAPSPALSPPSSPPSSPLPSSLPTAQAWTLRCVYIWAILYFNS